jgi:hypothetical protein
MYNDNITLLGLIDSYHDFHKLDKKNENMCLNLLKYYIKFKYEYNNKENKFEDLKNLSEALNFKNYDNKLDVDNNELEDNSNELEVNDDDYEDDNIFNDSFKADVNYHKNKINLFNKITKLVPKSNIKLKDLEKNIIDNFNKLFDFRFENKDLFDNTINFNSFISDEQKIMLRMPIFYLIKNKDNSEKDELINFLMEYMNLNIYNKEIQDEIKININNNLQNKNFENLTYPITYFDDMTTGLNKKNFKFNILNLDKKYIDAAKINTEKTYLCKYDYGENLKKILLSNTNESLGFSIDIQNDKINYMDSEFYFDSSDIVCNFNNIKLYIKNNSVGRRGSETNQQNETNNENDGIYQICIKLINIFDDIWKSFQNKNFGISNEIIDHVSKNQDNLKNELNNLVQNINLLNQVNILTNITDDDYHIIKNKINTKIHKKTFLKYMVELSVLQNESHNILSIINDLRFNIDFYKNIQLINNFIIKINEEQIYRIIRYYKKEFQKINIINIDYYYYFVLRTLTNMNKIDTNINKNEMIIKEIYILDKIYQNEKELNEIIDTTYLHLNLRRLYDYFNDPKFDSYNKLDLCKGCLVNLIFGAKRFGDWMQVNLSKKHYFILQTKDFYCKIYAYLIGAPVIFDDIIYNYMPPDDLIIDNKIFKIFNIDSDQTTLEEYQGDKNLIYKSLRDIKTPDISRYYFIKYLKYKAKYHDLKKKIESKEI